MSGTSSESADSNPTSESAKASPKSAEQKRKRLAIALLLLALCVAAVAYLILRPGDETGEGGGQEQVDWMLPLLHPEDGSTPEITKLVVRRTLNWAIEIENLRSAHDAEQDTLQAEADRLGRTFERQPFDMTPYENKQGVETIFVELTPADGRWRIANDFGVLAQAAAVNTLVERLREMVRPRRAVERITPAEAGHELPGEGTSLIEIYTKQGKAKLFLHDLHLARLGGTQDVYDITKGQGIRRLIPEAIPMRWRVRDWRASILPLAPQLDPQLGRDLLVEQIASVSFTPNGVAYPDYPARQLVRAKPEFGEGEFRVESEGMAKLAAKSARIVSLASYLINGVAFDDISALGDSSIPPALHQVSVELIDGSTIDYRISVPSDESEDVLLQVPNDQLFYRINLGRAAQLNPSLTALLDEITLADLPAIKVLNATERVTITEGQLAHSYTPSSSPRQRRPMWTRDDGAELKTSHVMLMLSSMSLALPIEGKASAADVQAAHFTRVDVELGDEGRISYEISRARSEGQANLIRLPSTGVTLRLSAERAAILAPTHAEILGNAGRDGEE